MDIDLSVDIAGIRMKNPVMCASGTFGFGEEYGKFFDLKKLGALVTKTITLKPMDGNLPPRVYETPSGMLNSIGLQNPGVKIFLKEKMPFLRKIGIPIIVSVGGETIEEYIKVVNELKWAEGILGIELNISCPNVKNRTRPQFSQDPDATCEVVKKVKKNTNFPLIVKLSPNVTDISVIAKSAQDGGADAVSLINTLKGMAVNIKKRTPILSTVTGGLSGPAVKPVALWMVWEVYNKVKIPIIGMGGIVTAQDALEFIICGAKAVAVGTANFINPHAIPEIIEGIKKYLIENKISSISSLTGSLEIGTDTIF